MIDVEILGAVQRFTKIGAYAGSMRQKAMGANSARIVEVVGMEQEFGVFEANQSLVKLIERGYVVEENGMLFLTVTGGKALKGK